jgi:hypothetical protein
MLEATTANGKPTGESEWPTATAVAAKIGCSRQQVYRLEKRGKLRGRDVRENGVKVRRFDPESVRALAEDQELEAILGADEAAETDEGDDAGGLTAGGMRLAARVVSESRQVALDARRGQQEAFELVTKPTQAIVELLLRTLQQREARIAELEKQLTQQFDEQRQARAEERELLLEQQRLERAELRKEQFFKMFVEYAPAVLEQMKRSAPNGPFVEMLQAMNPDEQKRLVLMVKSVITDDDQPASPSPPQEPASASPPEKGAQDGT